uniref:Uncharacterized protein n=1 Tax=Myoviridae sp. ctPuP5 TaxID=2823543 RepID=A0A8S5L9Q0_9CAUD|nr:MAG TPA: hypothetical protein [Myoviridae sp. ctPuP5]
MIYLPKLQSLTQIYIFSIYTDLIKIYCVKSR